MRTGTKRAFCGGSVCDTVVLYGETAVFGCFLKFELARRLELHVPGFNNQQLPFVLARNARWKTNISGISGHFCKLANYGAINPPSRPPRGMHLPTPARLGGRKSGLRRNPGPEGRCAKTQSGKVGALQYRGFIIYSGL